MVRFFVLVVLSILAFTLQPPPAEAQVPVVRCRTGRCDEVRALAHPPCVPYPRITRAEKQRLRSHYGDLMAIRDQTDDTMAAIAYKEANKLNELTEVVGPAKDQYGDPIYTHYGPRAYVGTPSYVGPRYPASFDRPYVASSRDWSDRSYVNGAYSVPGLSARTDTTLGVGASQSYMQSGMNYAPGLTATSAQRSMIFNQP